MKIWSQHPIALLPAQLNNFTGALVAVWFDVLHAQFSSHHMENSHFFSQRYRPLLSSMLSLFFLHPFFLKWPFAVKSKILLSSSTNTYFPCLAFTVIAYISHTYAHWLVVCGLEMDLHLHLCWMQSQCSQDHHWKCLGRSYYYPTSICLKLHVHLPFYIKLSAIQSQNKQANKLSHARCSKGHRISVCTLCLFVYIPIKKIPKECKSKYHCFYLLSCIWCYGAEISKPIVERWEKVVLWMDWKTDFV